MKKLLAAAAIATLALASAPAMAAGNSTYLGAKVLSWATGTAMPTPPTNVCLALFNGDPTDAGTGGTEVSSTIRTAGRVCGIGFGAVSGKTMTNSTVVSFGAAAAGATFTNFAFFDAATGGNMLSSGPITGGGLTVSAGTTVSFAIGALTWAE